MKYHDLSFPPWKASDDEVALIVLKRPPVTEKKIEEVEVIAHSIDMQSSVHLQMTEEDEVAVCAEGKGWMASAKEQQGFVKVCTIPGKLCY